MIAFKLNKLSSWVFVLVMALLGAFSSAFAYDTGRLFFMVEGHYQLQHALDSPEVELPYPFENQGALPYSPSREGGIYLSRPKTIDESVEYNETTREYEFNQKLGEVDYRRPSYMSLEEYQRYDSKKEVREYWKEKYASEQYQEKGLDLAPKLQVKSEVFDKIFGSDKIEIRPQGSIELIFGINSSKTENPAIPVKQQRITTFNFDEKIQFNVTGQIGEKLKLNMSYNTEAMFDFENITNLSYAGNEDDIIQLIEAGNVSLPLKGSLITGSQSLFGIKTGLKFGNLTVTSVMAQEKGQKSEIEIKGGAQVKEYQVKADQYEANRHFFLSHFFRDQYENNVSSPPLLRSEFFITKIEVYKTSINSFENNRNVIAFQDLGEGNPNRYYNSSFTTDNFPGNDVAGNGANNVYKEVSSDASVRSFVSATAALESRGLTSRRDFQRIAQAELLVEGQHYTVHKQLGYISLNQEIQNDFALAVSFQFTYRGKTYQVGEFSTDGINGQDALVVKLLKSVQLDLSSPMWDLMMKNIYSIGAYQIAKEGFTLDVWYLDQKTGVDINYLPEGSYKNKSIIQVLGMDKLTINNQQTPDGDGLFDFLDNPQISVIPRNGKIIFPLLEPFGEGLRSKFSPSEQDIVSKYTFDSLYTNTQVNAKVNYPNKNRFSIKGQYESSVSSDIPLGAFNIQKGSVNVTAGGQKLTENVDYTVDYTLGRVKIINQGILEANTPIKISMESNSTFNLQQKSMLGARFDYKINRNINVGGTVMNLRERPLTQKVNVGDEPINNTVWGIDADYTTESNLITTLIDKIPLLSTKEKSTINFSGEFAQLLPGHSRIIGKNGNSYIDDFEGSQSTIDLRAFTTWRLASTPQNQPALFPEGDLTNNIANGFNRAKIAWYVIDPTVFFRDNNITPSHIKSDPTMLSNHFMREVFENEVFPAKDLRADQPNNIALFDLAYYPEERGSYNYDVDGFDANGLKYGYGVNSDGTLKNPEKRWGGVMRSIETNDFDAANVEFLQFWVMDPFAEAGDPNYPADANGELIFHFGNISEDVLLDEYRFFENGLPTNAAEVVDLSGDTLSEWGRVIPPSQPYLLNAFDNNPSTREFQDVGLDGLRSSEEKKFHAKNFLDKIINIHGSSSGAYNAVKDDPSSDDYHYYRGDDYDASAVNILNRYKKYNNMEKNSPTSEQYASLNADGYPTTSTTLPNAEDVNNDKNMSEGESYYQYRVKISKSDINAGNVGNNFITNVLSTTSPANSGSKPVDWYQFKVPLNGQMREAFGGIQDLRSVRFMRMFLKGFDKPIFLRFARLELVRGEWRTYAGSCVQAGEGEVDDQFSNFSISAVNIEENSQKTPVNYILPPNILREQNFNTTNLTRQNEQSLAMDICNLPDGYCQSAYRNVEFDVRMYNRLQMFLHAEAGDDTPLNDDDLVAFVRLGTDFENNYYEYEIPLKVTPAGTYNGNDENMQKIVWPDANKLDIEFKQLLAVKTRRNQAVFGNTVSTLQRYTESDPNYTNNKITVVGNPNLSTLRVVMIGVRNPKDDGVPKCIELWANELRLTDFNDQSGWAAIGRVETKLADIGTLKLSGSMSTPGYGSIDKRVSERQQETIQQMDASFSTDIGRFLPKESGIKVPTYLGYSKGVVKPKFNPLDRDQQLDEAYNTLSNKELIDSIKNVTKELTQVRSLNFTNIRKEKTSKGDPKFYDVSNLTATYAYSETYKRSINIEHDLEKVYKGILGYSFSPSGGAFEPFKKSKWAKPKYLGLIQDFNINYKPKQVGFRTEVNRMYNAKLIRNSNPGIRAELPPFYNKTFDWLRQYDLKYDISKAIKFDFSATNKSLITEPQGRVDNKFYKDNYALWKDSVWNSASQGGTTTDYRHQANLSWTLPLKQIPLLDWLNSTAKYATTYNWMRAPFAADSIGHTIQNSNNININATANTLSLYNKVPYLKNVDRKFRQQGRKKPSKTRLQKKMEKVLENPADTTKTGEKKKEKKEKEKNDITPIDRLAKLLMSTKNLSATYTQTNGMLLPGYGKNTQLMGMDNKFEGPGVPFLFGLQEYNKDTKDGRFAPYAAEKGWLVEAVPITTQHTTSYNETMNLRASLEPINSFRVELTADYQYSLNSSEFFTWVDSLPDGSGGYPYRGQSFIETGSFSRSFISINTAFSKNDSNLNNAPYLDFLENRQIISDRLAQNRSNNLNSNSGSHSSETGYKEGYGGAAQEVLIPAFLAAYSGKSPGKVSLNPFSKIPNVNWRVTYSGLSKIKQLKKYFRSVTVNHAYRSTYNVGSFTSNLLYTDNEKTTANGYGFVDTFDINTNYIPKYQVNTVTINEQFSPLVNVDVTFKNGFQSRFEIKKDRMVSLNVTNTQITEVRGFEITVGMGYKIPSVEIPVKFNGQTTNLKSDLNLRADFSMRDNNTIIRKVVENSNTATAGQKIISMKFSADYRVSQQLSIRAFYDWVSNKPFITRSFPTSNINAGISLRFTLTG